MGDPKGTISQLNAARDIVLKDAAIYPQVVPGVLPVISSGHPVELRRWGAEFLSETFASPVLNAEDKEKLSLGVLDTLKGYLARKEEQGEDEDEGVVKAAVQAATSIYPLVFRHVIGSGDSEIWSKMAGIKSNILRRMDSASGGVRICCIKFVARVVQVQTPGVIADPRRGEQNEISLALVPREHKVLTPSNLEAEASGLLDRLLGVLQDNITDPLIATATLNALSSLVKRRATISNKILSTILNFNPLLLASSSKPMTPKDKVAVRSMTRTTMSFLLNILKSNPNHTLAGRIQAQVERLRQSLTDVFTDQNPLKRPAPDEPIDGLSDEKRQRVESEMEGGNTPQNPSYPPLPPGPASLAQLFNLTTDQRAAGFHVEAIPVHFVSQLIPHLLTMIDQHRFDTAINVVRARYLELQRRPAPGAGVDSGTPDDYDPTQDFGAQTPTDGQVLPPQQDLVNRPTGLPSPERLNEQERKEFEDTAKDRLFSALEKLEVESRQKVKKANVEKEKGFNRLAASGDADREGWIALLTRLATRTTPSPPDEGEKIKSEGEDAALQKKGGQDLPTKLREAFHKYIMDDWRTRIDLAISWLNEEWYSDRLTSRTQTNQSSNSNLPNYTPSVLHLLTSISPYLDTKDTRYLTRFLSELPSLPDGLWEQVARIADDPERVKLVCDTLLYLVMLRPPVRERALDCLEGIWRGNEAARGVAGRVLGRWRPEVVKEGLAGEGMKGEVKEEG